MKTTLKNIIISFTCAALLIGCTVNIDDQMVYETDNEYTNWTYHSSSGYSGGDVEFAGITIAGEWSVVRVHNNSGLLPTFDNHISVIFDDIRWYTYEYDLDYGETWTYELGYGVSRNGLKLNLDDFYSYTVESLEYTENIHGYCINATENMTGDTYSFCKIN